MIELWYHPHSDLLSSKHFIPLTRAFLEWAFVPGPSFSGQGWPTISTVRARCNDCNRNAPTQAPLPSTSSTPPSTPFEEVFTDFFDCGGRHYLVIGDRLSGWCEVFRSTHGSPQVGAEGLITCLWNYFSRFGVPIELSSDGGPEFVANATEIFLQHWGVSHRLSSAYHQQSNGRAEVAIKSAKRLLKSNTGPSGTLDTDRFLRAMMQLCNTPDPDCNISPAQIVFGRPLRDTFAFTSRLDKFANKNIRPTWRNAWRSKEAALYQRFHRSAETLSEHSRELPTVQVGDRCYIQNQTGNFPKRWDRSGTIVDVHDHDSYTVKVDGTGRITRRNRRFLRRFVPATSTINSRPPYPKVVCLPNDALHSPAPAVKPSQRVYSSEPDAPNTDDSLGYRQSTDSVPLSPLVLQECNPSAHTEAFPMQQCNG